MPGSKKESLWARAIEHARYIVASHSSTAKLLSPKKAALAMHEIKNCPCCQKPFECKSGSITLCQCTEVKISGAARELLAKKYDECLCKQCLLKIEDECKSTGKQ